MRRFCAPSWYKTPISNGISSTEFMGVYFLPFRYTFIIHHSRGYLAHDRTKRFIAHQSDTQKNVKYFILFGELCTALWPSMGMAIFIELKPDFKELQQPANICHLSVTVDCFVTTISTAITRLEQMTNVVGLHVAYLWISHDNDMNVTMNDVYRAGETRPQKAPKSLKQRWTKKCQRESINVLL